MSPHRGAVLVTDANERAALASVRSLGRAGFAVDVVADRPRTLAGASRYCRHGHLAPSPLSDPAAFGQRVVELVTAQAYDIVLPISEASHLALYPVEAGLSPARLAAAPGAAFTAICDKRRVLTEAAMLGLRVPGQVVLTAPPEFNWATPPGLLFPLVVKPARSVVDQAAARQKLGVRHAADRVALDAILADYPESAYPLLLQQRVPGEGVGVFLLLWNGREIANFAHRRIREKPPSGGVSVARESIAQDPVLLDRTRSLLARFGWSGPAMVEFKRGTDGHAYLMEINGRFWGSLQLAIDAGVDFPRILVEAVLGQPSVPAPTYAAGVRTRWWWGEVDHLLTRLRNPGQEALLPNGTPGRLHTTFDILLDGWRGGREEVLRMADPSPFLHETLSWLRGGR